MKKLLTTTVAAAALIGVMASDANAFGISINLGSLFGGRYIHRTHHSYGSRRHATRHETRQASRHATRHETRQASRRSNGHKPEEAAKPTQPKDLPLVTVISGNYSTADQVRIKYNSLQKEFKDLIGPVTIFTYGTIGDFRAKTKKYDAPDNATGYSLEYTYDKDHSHAYCAVHLIESAGPEEYADRSLVHELGHCVDFGKLIDQTSMLRLGACSMLNTWPTPSQPHLPSHRQQNLTLNDADAGMALWYSERLK
jgi:hypothetical protein